MATITSGNVNKYLRGTRLEVYQTPTESGMYTSGISDGIIRTMPFDTEGNTSELDYDLMGYTAFGKYLIGHATTNSINPFGYNGEVTDSDTGTGLIYLRNRYYDPEIGRFLTVDPAMDGTNWYSYCENDPVNKTDPLGLFGKNTKLGITTSYDNPDVYELQKRLNELGYTDKYGNKLAEDGDFGTNTLYAVNSYKNANGICNTGEYYGIVGITTWEHMGLEVDNDYEFGFSQSVPGVTQTNLYARFNGLQLNNGIVLGSAEMGMSKVGGDYQYFEWEVNTMQGKAKAGITTEYVGAELGASLFSAEGGFKMPLPLTDKSLYIGGSGELFGVGFATYYSNGKLK